MLLWPLLLVLVPGTGESYAQSKAVLLFHPPWTTIFQGEVMTMTCREVTFSETKRALWMFKGNWISNYYLNTIQVTTAGEYQCQTRTSSLSDPVNLVVSSDWLILQVPHSIFEGDRVILSCRGRKEENVDEIIYYKDGKKLHTFTRNSSFVITKAVSDNNGFYTCTTSGKSYASSGTRTSNLVRIEVQELFPHPVLTASSYQPVKGSSVTLTCETQLSPQRPDAQLQFRFFRDGRALGSGWSRSPKLQISTRWSKPSESYWCKAQTVTSRIWKQSRTSQIYVHIPVSRPVLTLGGPRAQAVVGDLVELHCEAQRGSPPILYRFYHEDVTLGNSSAPSGGGASFNLSLTSERSGNYSCEADNGLGTQRSEMVPLKILEPAEDKSRLLAAGVTGGLLGFLAAAALLVYLWFQRKSGAGAGANSHRNLPSPGPQEHTYANLPAPVKKLETMYNNVNPTCLDVVYSQIWNTHQGQQGAEHQGAPPEGKASSVVYSEVKKVQPAGASAQQPRQEGTEGEPR